MCTWLLAQMPRIATDSRKGFGAAISMVVYSTSTADNKTLAHGQMTTSLVCVRGTAASAAELTALMPVNCWKKGIRTVMTSCGRKRRSSSVLHGCLTCAACQSRRIWVQQCVGRRHCDGATATEIEDRHRLAGLVADSSASVSRGCPVRGMCSRSLHRKIKNIIHARPQKRNSRSA